MILGKKCTSQYTTEFEEATLKAIFGAILEATTFVINFMLAHICNWFFRDLNQILCINLK